jgi:predicted phage terminase large subunit-like protein
MAMRKRPLLSEGQYDKQVAELRAFIKEAVSPFEDDTPAKKKERIARSLRDKLYFMQTYLPHYFTSAFGEFHHEWAEIAGFEDQFALVGAPREHAKSTFFSFGDPLHAICHALIKFGLQFSDTHEQAQGFTVAVKLELEENVRIRHDFGDLRTKHWSDDDFKTKNGIWYLARGRRDKIRGLKNGPHRPDYARFDDMENDDNVENPRLVKRMISWIRGSVIGSMGKGYKALMVGNLFHPRSAISQLIALTDEEAGGPLYFSRVYDAILDEGTPDERPLWPANWSMERLLKKKRDMGTFDFNREMRNKVAVDGSPFPDEQAQYYEPSELAGKELVTVTALDPSAKAGENNDYRAVVTWSLDRATMTFYCRHAWLKKRAIGEMFAAAYAQRAEYGSECVEVEENMLKDFLHEAIANYAKDVGSYLPWSPVNHSTNKEARIVGTCAYLWEFGKMKFLKGHSDQILLKDQFVYILTPAVHDDGPDATEMAISKLQNGCFTAAGISSDPDTDTYRPERAEGITGRLGRIFNRRHA